VDTARITHEVWEDLVFRNKPVSVQERLVIRERLALASDATKCVRNVRLSLVLRFEILLPFETLTGTSLIAFNHGAIN
jgi:hypothetical protein